MLITWDESKRLANLVKHKLDFADFETAFSLDRFVTRLAKQSRQGRARYILIGGWSGGVAVAAIVEPLGSEALSLISLRRASSKERLAYERL